MNPVIFEELSIDIDESFYCLSAYQDIYGLIYLKLALYFILGSRGGFPSKNSPHFLCPRVGGCSPRLPPGGCCCHWQLLAGDFGPGGLSCWCGPCHVASHRPGELEATPRGSPDSSCVLLTLCGGKCHPERSVQS